LAAAIQGRSERIGIVSCYSRSADKRAAFVDKFGTGQHDSYEAVLADPDIDAVILTTPHSLHAAHIEQAAAAGKHVFVEKPMTLTAASGRAAAAACARAGVVLAVGHNRRFAPAAVELKRMIETGEIGTLLHLEANFSAPGALSYTPDRWRASRVESPGGGLAGLGIHMIDLLCWLAGPVVRLSAQSKRLATPVDMDDTTSAIMEFTSGATGYLGTVFVSPMTTFLNVYGTDANAFAEIDGNEVRVHAAGAAARENRELETIDTLRAELEAFAASCVDGAELWIDPEEAAHAVAVMEAIVDSAARGGQPVQPDRDGE
jgi:predicted dehydrogenase